MWEWREVYAKKHELGDVLRKLVNLDEHVQRLFDGYETAMVRFGVEAKHINLRVETLHDDALELMVGVRQRASETANAPSRGAQKQKRAAYCRQRAAQML